MYIAEKLVKRVKRLLTAKGFETLKLWDKIPKDTFLNLIDRKDCRIWDCSVDFNSYGQYLFFTVSFGNLLINGYTAGIHEYRGKKEYDITVNDISLLTDKNQYTANINFNMPKSKAWFLEQLFDRYNLLDYQIAPDEIPMFNEIADLSDDDFALANIDEMLASFGEV